MRIDELLGTFKFPTAVKDSVDAKPSWQDIHDLAAALGATCEHCATKSKRPQRKTSLLLSLRRCHRSSRCGRVGRWRQLPEIAGS